MQGNDEVTTILTELSKFEVNFELLKETRVGIIVNKCKKKFQDIPSISTQCSELIDTWKKSAEASKKPPTNSSIAASVSSFISTASGTGSQTTVAVAAAVAETKSLEPLVATTDNVALPDTTEGASPRDAGINDEEFNSLFESLPANRKKVVELLANILAAGLSTSQAAVTKFLAFSIESSLTSTFKDSESYMAKFRSLSSNLKKNDVRSSYANVLFNDYVLYFSPSSFLFIS